MLPALGGHSRAAQTASKRMTIQEMFDLSGKVAVIVGGAPPPVVVTPPPQPVVLTVLPANCVRVMNGNVLRYQCGTLWYAPEYSGPNIVYVPVNP